MDAGAFLNRDAIVELLAGAPTFRGLARQALAAAADAAAQRRVRAGGFVFREGEPAEAFWLVLTGRLKLSQTGPAGNEVIVRFVGPGEVAAALTLFEGAMYPVSARALRDSSLLVWSRTALQGLVERDARLAANLLEMLSARMREVQDRFRELATERVPQRIASALLRLVDQAGRKIEDGVLIDLPLSRRDLAELTGTTLYTVSRVLSHWESQRIVATGRARIVVRRQDALAAIAEYLSEDRGHRT
jgi:CRP-like cAMP-binding protein